MPTSMFVVGAVVFLITIAVGGWMVYIGFARMTVPAYRNANPQTRSVMLAVLGVAAIVLVGLVVAAGPVDLTRAGIRTVVSHLFQGGGR